MQISQIVRFLDKLQEYGYKDSAMQEAIGIVADSISLGQVQIQIKIVDGENDKYLAYQKYDTKMLNVPDFQEQIPLESSEGFVLFSFWKESAEQIWNEDEVGLLRLMSRVMLLHMRKYKRQIKDRTAVTHDVASGTFNATGYVMEGQKIIDAGEGDGYTALYLNISKFKLINQMYGHKTGNLTITFVARKLKEFLDKEGENQFVGRLGGDNFVAMVKDCNVDRFIRFLSDFEVETVYQEEEIRLKLSFFIGVYHIKKEDQNMSAVMENSSVAYSIARHKDRFDPVYYDEDLHRQILREKEIESKMRSALENREFIVYYQPKIDLSNYQINGAEALVRWLDEGRIVPPMEFIPIFERNGFICNIDFYVLNSVCKSMRHWLDQGINVVTVSVNFSKVHFCNPRFTEQIVEVIKRYRIPSKYIEIEFTESVDFQDKEGLVKAVEDLKSYGITTSMDDFGTGFSSLGLLKTLPVDVLKIDKSLLDTQTSFAKERVIISNMVRMVREMNIQVITEGVETQEQVDFLKEINCEYAQGFLFDKPLPIELFEKRLIKGYYEGGELTNGE